ncbi:MOSC domain-containing protein [Agrobacterium sp. ES01]|uniref:MOSC domain-containing protein n=1 Tax=Agrobacterium sp. ES01 TaxID=3420714 RepID=UPI003D13C117
MKSIGRILELWRYPVSSLPGELCQALDAQPGGIIGDRRFALFDAETGLAASPEREPRWRPALFLTCGHDETGHVCIGLPGETAMRLNDPALPDALSGYFGFSVNIGSYEATDEPLDRQLPVVSNRYDVSDIHIVTTASLTQLADIGAFAELDQRRFRPTILVETPEADGFVENDWIGRTLHIGDTVLKVTEPAKRCGMTMIAQPGIAEQPEVLRHILRYNRRNLGVYCAVQNAATLSVGLDVYAEA